MSRRYYFTHAAEEDLLAIWLYTDGRWGEAQADTYQDALHEACQHVADGIAVSRSFEGMEQVRFFHAQHHYLFFVTHEEGITVIAVLHDRMDLPARLSERLAAMEGKPA